MKRVLVCILFAGPMLMGQDTLILKNGEQRQVWLIEIRENSVIVEVPGVDGKPHAQGVPLRLVDKIILKDGTVIWESPEVLSNTEFQDSAAVNGELENVMSTPKYSTQASISKYYSQPAEQSIEESMAQIAEAHSQIAEIITYQFMMSMLLVVVTLLAILVA